MLALSCTVSVAFDWHPTMPSCNSLNVRAQQPFMIGDTSRPGPGPG